MPCFPHAAGSLEHAEETADSSANRAPPVGDQQGATMDALAMAAVERRRRRETPQTRQSAHPNAPIVAAQTTSRPTVPSRGSSSRTVYATSVTSQVMSVGIVRQPQRMLSPPDQPPQSLPPPPPRRTTSDSAAESTPKDFGRSRPSRSTPRRSLLYSQIFLPDAPGSLRVSAARHVETAAQVRAAATHLPHWQTMMSSADSLTPWGR